MRTIFMVNPVYLQTLAEPAGVEPARRLKRLASNKVGLPHAQWLREVSILEETVGIEPTPRCRVHRFQGEVARQLPSSPSAARLEDCRRPRNSSGLTRRSPCRPSRRRA